MDLELALFGGFISYALIIIGVGLGIGIIGGIALLGMARQPEIAGKLQASALVFAALIEGVALLSVILSMTGISGVLELIAKQIH